MSTPNANTITEYTANKNAELADEFELAAEALRKLHNEGFNEGVLAGLKSLAESCKARREKQVPNNQVEGAAGCLQPEAPSPTPGSAD